MAVAFVRAVQAAGVEACVKHYVATSRRPTAPPISRGWNRRTLREVYLAPFERVVRDAAVRSGCVPESVVDDKVVRILAVAKRVDALSGRPGQVEPYRVPDGLPEPDGPGGAGAPAVRGRPVHRRVAQRGRAAPARG
jgi:beta-glucosidase-like glycosyl hydrolase